MTAQGPNPRVANPSLVAALLTREPLPLGAVASARLLVPGQGEGPGQVALRVGAGLNRGRVVWAFTDAEALQAWAKAPLAEAGVLDGPDVAELVGEGDDDVLALNPAGPGARVLDRDQVEVELEWDGRTWPEGEAGGGIEGTAVAAGWPGAGDPVEPTGRHPLRAAIREEAQMGADLEAADRHAEALDHLDRALAACRTLGDRVHGAAVLAQQVKSLVALDRLDAATAAAERAGLVLVGLGDLDTGFDALLDAAWLALAGGDRGRAGRLALGAVDSFPAPWAPRLARLCELLIAPGATGGAT